MQLKEQTINLPLENIRLHPTYKKLLPHTPLTYLSNELNKLENHAVEIFLLTNPIVLVETKKIYHLIAGKRSYDIAICRLEKSTNIPCRIITSKNENLITEIILSDILLAKSFYSILKAGHLGDIFTKIMQSDLLPNLKNLVDIDGKEDLVKIISKTYNTIFLPPKKSKTS